MNVKLAQSFAILLLCVNVCVAYHFYNPSATVTISGVSYPGVSFYADVDLNAQQLVYPTNPNSVTETEMYSNNARYQICSSSSCSAYYIPYKIPNYQLTSLSPISTNVRVNGINTNYYKYTDSGFLVELWAVPNVSPANIVQVKQSGNGLDRQIFFGNTNDYNTVRTMSAPSSTQYPGCASKIQCGSAMDIVLVVDTSGSIAEADYVTEKNYVQSVVDRFDVSDVGVHVGYVTFSTAAYIRANLTSSTATLANVIQNTAQDFGETNIGGAINAAHDIFRNYGRANVPHVIILLTDGNANIPSPAGTATKYMTDAATSAKNDNIDIYAIGVGAQLDTQLQLIASGPSYISSVANFDALSTTLSAILKTVCVGGDSNACSSTCANTQFCGCESCLCAQSSSVCGSRGVFDTNSCSCTCTGNWKNTNTLKDCSSCPLTCAHGTKNSGDCTCTCNNLWTGNTCSECDVSCIGNTYNQTDCRGCACSNFWSGTDCLTCNNNIPSTHCFNGGSIANTATCSGCNCLGFYTAASSCQQCSPGCVNGKASPGCTGCDCTGTNFSGTKCETCALDCNGHGSVVDKVACSKCTCTAGTFFTSSSNCKDCDTTYCKNGGTANAACDTCTCTGNWEGDDCTTCGLTCGANKHANDACTACVCNTNYDPATNCATCVTDVCVNGYLDITKQCLSCVCDTNATGNTCDSCKSTMCNGHGTANDACTACTCTTGTYYTPESFCQTCDNSVCQSGSTMKSSCDSCTCKKGWSDTLCDKCTKTNYAKTSAPCVNSTIADSCVSLLTTSSSSLGKVCFNTDSVGKLIVYSTLTNSNDQVTKTTVELSTNTAFTGSTTYKDSKSFVFAGRIDENTNYYVKVKVETKNGNVGYSAVSANAQTYTFLDVQTCTDCVCALNCNHGNPKDSSCNSCICDNYWSGSRCDVCDTSNRSVCNGIGHLIPGLDNACDSCSCDSSYSTGKDCGTCTFECVNGSPNDACNGCDCDPGWGGSDCSICQSNLLCYGRGSVLVECTKCTCSEPWGGDRCDVCQLDCNNHGHGVLPNCDTCVCDSPWTGTDCMTCSSSALCNSRGTAQDTTLCNKCTCDQPWGGDNCQTCEFSCNGHGTPDPVGCASCTCDGAFTVASNCLECDFQPNCTYCNKRGNITDLTTCDVCTCEDYWGGDRCEECKLNCNGKGTRNTDCSACNCVGQYTSESNCTVCPIVCNNGGSHNGNCDGCNCVNGWGGANCDVCQERQSNCKHSSILNTQTCSCDCVDQWTGRLCDTCDIASNPCNYPDQGFLLTSLNGISTCVCACAGYWTGETCGMCTLNPDYGDATCAGTRVADLSTCTCHCPKFYSPLDESCKTCIITPDDCVHPLEAGQPVDLVNCNCGPCIGNYEGRDCSVCGITSCPRGYAFNADTCDCDVVCGNDVLSEGEQCEIELMDPKDQVCCTDCQFNSSPCDDQVSCTYDDLCVQGTCSGLSGLDFTTDQNRQPMQPGVIPANAFSRLGVSVVAENTIPILYSTSSAARSNLLFPNTNIYGGDTNFGLVIVQQTIQSPSSICLSFSSATQYTLASILGVSKVGTFVEITCGDNSRSSFVPKTWTQIGGNGSVEYIPIPCGLNGLKRICYYNLNDAAIGPLTSCGTASLPLGAIGDYVWSDYNRDNVQDSSEPGISGATVSLFGDSDNGQGKGKAELLLSTTTTNAAGFYLFSNLYPGNYLVQFTGPTGFIFSTPLTLDGLSYRGNTSVFFLSQGQTDLTRDAGLYFSGQIGDFVWNDKDQDGVQTPATEPGVPGVVVNLYYSENINTIIKTTTTDSTGKYLFDDLLILKSSNSYYSYTVGVVPPAKAVVTAPFRGSSTTSDSNFDVNTYLSDTVVLGYTSTTKYDNTIDCGIYYHGSIGDYVWFDKNKNGLQDNGEIGASSVSVVLYWNGLYHSTTTTDSTGLYLFSKLPLTGEYQVYFSKPNSPLPSNNYIFTKQLVGTDKERDSDVNASGISGKIILTDAVPDVRSVDAGIVEGCGVDSDCAASDNKCVTASCNLATNVCQYSNTKQCQISTDSCFYYQCNPVTGDCDKLATGITCDDGNLCTSDDKCTKDGCKGTPNTSPCNDNNQCTTNDKCSAGVCAGTTTLCPPSPNQCKTTVCNTVTGCNEVDLAENTPCSDGLLCTVGDVCKSGTCVAGPRVTCQANDDCHSYACSESAGGKCATTILTNSNCNDKNDCTENDKCSSDGTCAGTPKTCEQDPNDPCHTYSCSAGECVKKFIQKSCDDKRPCTLNDVCVLETETCQGTPKYCPPKDCQSVICNSVGDCQYTPNNALTCFDNNPCTTDVCVNGKCVHNPIKCDDSNPCTDDECENGECVFLDNFSPCDDKNPCTETDTCSLGSCKGIPKNCDDNEFCTEDLCDAGNCVHNPLPSTQSCDDGNKCTPHAYCVSGKCQGYDSVICNDNNVCTDDKCDLATGECTFTYNESPCNDNDECTVNGVCSKGTCISEPINCEPVDNVCLTSVCANGKCSYEPDPAATTCDDFNKCTTNDKCIVGVCTGTPLDCTSNDVCYDAVCVKEQGCVLNPNKASCDDHNICTSNDICSNGVCAGTPIVCDDNNPCTDDKCVKGVCEYTPNSSPCDDKNPCTIDDICSDSKCAPGLNVVCDDSNSCTSDKCNLITGECEFAPLPGTSCTDYNACTNNDVCSLTGECFGGTPTVCDGSPNPNPCLDYFCNAVTGLCDSKPNTAACEDNDPCTSISRCSNGVCVGVPVICPKLSDCVGSVCDANQNGICVPTKLTGTQYPCSDGDACTTGDTCENGLCAPGTRDPNCGGGECTIDSDCTPVDKCHTVKCVNKECVNTPKLCPLTANPCTENTCSLTTGECKVSPISGTCDDGDKCTQTDVCVLGECVGTNPKSCSTSENCKISRCNKSTGDCDISTIADNVTPCDDQNKCTLPDVCTSNGCVGTPVTCNDNNPCTTDSCENGACKYVNNAERCSDGDACTSDDFCQSGLCNPGTPLVCNDNNVCTADRCEAGVCSFSKLSHTPCNDGNLCTTDDTCTNGQCAGTPNPCDDNDPCTKDMCDPNTGGCIHPPADDSTTCDDHNLCTTNDMCKSGKCTGTTYCPPADATVNECITYSCDPEVGGCVREYTTDSCTNTAKCFQTSGKCSGGECISDPVVCTDGLFCTVDRCNPSTGQCEFINNNVTCTPQVPDACHQYVCLNSVCSPVNPKDCDDKNPCTTDSCVNGDCKHVPLTDSPCSDGNSCTTNDVCTSDGTCKGTPKVCADDNVCTDDVCVDGECVFKDNNAVCQSTNKCVQESRCSNKVCVVTANVVCPPRDCYDAQCNPTTGNCDYTANDALPCTDNKICTNDFCRAGVCQHSDVVCTRGSIPCVDYVCDESKGGCVTRPNDSLTCSDSDLCTNDKCSNGECVHTDVVCNTASCSYGSYCNPSTGNCDGGAQYSCKLSPCHNYDCQGYGTCVLKSFNSTYQPLIYLSVKDGNDASISNYKIITLNATSTNVATYVSNFQVPQYSIDIDPNTGVVFNVYLSQTKQNLGRLSKGTNGRIRSNTITPLKELPTSVTNMAISLRPKFVNSNTPYTQEIWGFDQVTDTFYVYAENGTVISAGLYFGPLDAAIISWDHYGRSAFYFKKNDKTLYLWQQDSFGNPFSVAICNNVTFGTGNIVAIDTAVDGTLWVGTNNPVALYVVSPQLSATCVANQVTLPANVTAAGVVLYSLTLDNTFCPVVAPIGKPPPSTLTVTATPTPSGVTTANHGPAEASVNTGSVGAASGNNGAFPGQDTNYPLTGTTGYATTAVVGTVAGIAVLFAAIFGAVLGLNTSKEDKTVPLDTLLATQDVQSVASDSPIFLAPGGIQNNPLGN